MYGASASRITWVVVGVLLAVTTPSWGLSCITFQTNSSWSPCPGMTATKDIHLDQLNGNWYMHETVVPPGGEGYNETETVRQLCMRMTLERSARGFTVAGTIPGEKEPWRNNATLLVQEPTTYPGLWDETVLVEGKERSISRSQLMYQDAKALVVAVCPPTSAYACNELGTKPTILVWGRNATANSLDLVPINARLRQAGIGYVDKAVRIDTGSCSGLV